MRVYTDSIYFCTASWIYRKDFFGRTCRSADRESGCRLQHYFYCRKIRSGEGYGVDASGKDGSEKVYVDYYGKVLQIGEDSKEDPVQGNNVYLTIDKDLQIACYKVLEQKIAGVLVANIQNIKTFKADENTDASTIDPNL